MTVELGQQTYQWKERWLVIRSDNHAKRQKNKLIKRLETAEKKIRQLSEGHGRSGGVGGACSQSD